MASRWGLDGTPRRTAATASHVSQCVLLGWKGRPSTRSTAAGALQREDSGPCLPRHDKAEKTRSVLQRTARLENVLRPLPCAVLAFPAPHELGEGRTDKGLQEGSSPAGPLLTSSDEPDTMRQTEPRLGHCNFQHLRSVTPARPFGTRRQVWPRWQKLFSARKQAASWKDTPRAKQGDVNQRRQSHVRSQREDGAGREWLSGPGCSVPSSETAYVHAPFVMLPAARTCSPRSTASP